MRIGIQPKWWGIILQNLYEIVGIILLIVGFLVLGTQGRFDNPGFITCWTLGIICVLGMICVIIKRRFRSPWVWLGIFDLLCLPLAIPFYLYIRDEHLDYWKEKELNISWARLDNLAMLQLAIIAINWVWVLGYLIISIIIGLETDGSLAWMVWFSLVAAAYLIGTVFTFSLLLNVHNQFPIPKITVILSLLAVPATWPLGIRMLQKPHVRYVEED